MFEFFKFKKLGPLNQSFQIVVVLLSYVATVFAYWYQVKATGKMEGYTPGVSILFVPVYEEMIFRGVLLKFFESHYGKWIAIGASVRKQSLCSKNPVEC